VEDVEAAAMGGVDRIVVAGGDGSIGPAAAAAAGAGVPLALVPVGTANDFARALGIPREVSAASRLAATGTELRTLELAWMDGRPFVNVASAGLAASAAERARAWKRRLGLLAYFLGAAQAGLRERPLECRIMCNGGELFSGRAWQVIVASSGAFGAGSRVGVAHPADGQLDATVIEASSRVRLLARAYGLRSGRIVSQRGVHHARAARVEVSVPAGTAYNVDGEIVVHGPAEFRVEAEGFQVVTG
jgi:diacylglycerol kinase (ATP)